MNAFTKSCDLVRRYAVHTLVCAAMGIGATAANAATVVANFDDGNGSGADGYVGADVGPGSWQGPWGFSYAEGGADTSATTILNDGNSPVPGGGNYLKVIAEPDSGNDDAARTSLFRRYTDGGAGEIDAVTPHHIEFTYRIDEDIDSGSSTFDNYHDRYEISASGTGASNDSSDSWSVFGHGGSGTFAPAGIVKQWAFYNGSSNGSFVGANMVDTEIDMVTGGIYHFIIDVDPVAKTWDGTIEQKNAAGATIDSFTQTGMGFRSSSWRKAIKFSTKKSRDLPAGSDVRAFSIDNFSITNVPEPSTVLLTLLGSTIALGAARRRKHA